MTTTRYEPVALPDSPYAKLLQEHCLSLPGAYEDYPWGEVVYKVGKKLFAMMGGVAPLRVTVKADPHDAEFLIELPNISRAAYVGRYGWVTIDVHESMFDLTRDLITASHALVAPKRLLTRS